ncbi:hypothetical protein [Streptomyces sp. NPDC053367]|uniref:hypothetical protein n=1 Tax=Streptomyces sp. NPDC053367 TaxID=3365700 RepID=UPI0037CE65A3
MKTPSRRTSPTGRRTTTVLTAAGTALAITVLAVPNAHAADSDITFSSVVWNNGRPIVVGTGADVRAPLTYKVKTDVKLDGFWVDAYRGTWSQNEDRMEPAVEQYCPQSSTGGYTYYNCSDTVILNAAHLANSDAGTWNTYGTAVKAGGGWDDDLLSTTVGFRRASLITSADASPEPVTKGQAITVTGTLKRANWDTHRYDPYGGQKATLQFKAAGTTTYTNIRTVTTSLTGLVKTSVTATKDGTWRWYYAGNVVTGAKATGGDYVDVR